MRKSSVALGASIAVAVLVAAAVLLSGGLANPSFEGAYAPQDGIPEINVAAGWTAWRFDDPPCRPGADGCSYPCPTNCDSNSRGECRGDVGCYWARPEFGAAAVEAHPQRVRSGERAAKLFNSRMHEAGLYQQVTVAPGDELRFSVHAMTWQCSGLSDDDPDCTRNSVSYSDKPYDGFVVQVGIDPLGGTNPQSSSVVWSSPTTAFDQWTLLSVEAVAQAGVVTVFTRSQVRYDWLRVSNDTYLDDASLVVLQQPPTPAPSFTPPPSPVSTPMPRPVQLFLPLVVHNFLSPDLPVPVVEGRGISLAIEPPFALGQASTVTVTAHVTNAAVIDVIVNYSETAAALLGAHLIEPGRLTGLDGTLRSVGMLYYAGDEYSPPLTDTRHLLSFTLVPTVPSEFKVVWFVGLSSGGVQGGHYPAHAPIVHEQISVSEAMTVTMK